MKQISGMIFHIPYSGLTINIVKLSILPKGSLQTYVIPIKIFVTLFPRIKTNNPKISVDPESNWGA